MGTEFKESMLNPNLMWLDSMHCPTISGLRSLTSFLHKRSRRPPCPLYHLHASFKRRTLICPNRQPGCENSPVVLAWKYKLSTSVMWTLVVVLLRKKKKKTHFVQAVPSCHLKLLYSQEFSAPPSVQHAEEVIWWPLICLSPWCHLTFW